MKTDYQPGDIVFMRTAGLMGRAIRFAQRNLQDALSKYSHWNHVGILHEKVGNDWTVIQAQPKGITAHGLLSEMAGADYEVIALPAYINPLDVLAFAQAQVGKEYGFASAASAFLDMVLPRQVCLRKADTWICSGLVLASLWYAGFHPAVTVDDLYSITPAEVALLLGR
jgi:Permuted papain-like amidase enzyme, YaeF/YiiX, C92 family